MCARDIRPGRATLREMVMASAGILTSPKFEARLAMLSGRHARPEFAARFRVADPFNRPGVDIDPATFRSNPTAWRAIEGGQAGRRGPVTPDEIRDRQNKAGIARHYRADHIANRLERELAEDIRRYGRTWQTRTGFPLGPIGGGSAA
jgi:hypothetical protein